MNRNAHKSDLLRVIDASCFKPDRYGHHQFTSPKNGEKYRLKFKKVNLRFERQVISGDGKKEWFAVWSKPWSKIDVKSFSEWFAWVK